MFGWILCRSSQTQEDSMNIIIAGDGKVGSMLTCQLSGEGHDVTVIDCDDRVLAATVDRYDVMAVHGNCASMDILMQAGVKDADSVLDAFAAIADGEYTFISRGDGSGTHSKELSLWPEALGITKDPASFANYTKWYVSANAGMGACLVMAEEMGAYILTDKATFLTFVANDGVMG